MIWNPVTRCTKVSRYEQSPVGLKPMEFPIELADLLIRRADNAKAYGNDQETALEEKLNYNRLRPLKHGWKKA